MTADIPTLATPRLILRPLELADAAAVQALFPRWEIVRFLASHVPWPYPADGAATFIRNVALPAIERGTAWHWSIRPKAAPQRLIGVISLMDKPSDNRGFWLDPSWQGQGLMSEAASAVTDYWFETLERPVLRVPKAVANVSSRRISERSGMRVIETGHRDYVSGHLPAEVWEITREAWRERRAKPLVLTQDLRLRAEPLLAAFAPLRLPCGTRVEIISLDPPIWVQVRVASENAPRSG